jgi:RNA polymerase sigma-70 factor (ECF subfamily)
MVESIQTGNNIRESGMEAIMAEHETALLRYAARILNNPSMAQDVVQNVFIKLYKGWQEGMKPSKKLKSWLYRVTHNEAVDFIRKETRIRNLHKKHSEEKAEQECADGHNCPAEFEDRKAMVLEHVRKLHQREQQILLLRMEEGLSYKEIAAVTGRTEGNVGNILHNAINKLAQRVKTNRE